MGAFSSVWRIAAHSTIQEVKKMMNLLKRLWMEDDGQGMVEYGLIIALVAVVVIGALVVMGDSLSDTFNDIVDRLTPAEG